MKKFTLIAVGLLIVLSIFSVRAQESSATTNAFKPGWNIGLNGGINMFMGEGNNIFNPDKSYLSPFKKNYSFLGRLAVGYNFTAIVGLRGMLGYHSFNWYTVPENSPVNTFSTENLTADLLINLTNWAKGYDTNRKLDFSAFAGIGGAYLNNNTNLTPIAGIVRGGLQSDYHINPKLNLNLMLELNLTTDNYNDVAYSPAPVDIFPVLTFGLTYNISKAEQKIPPAVQPEIQPKTEDKPVKTEEPVTKPVEPTAVASTGTKPAVTSEPVKEIKEVNEPKETPIAPVPLNLNEKIFFTANKATIINKPQEDAITNIVNFMKQYPNSTVTISGYADKSTGSIEANNLMSKMRAVTIANTLIRKYGISSKRLYLKWYGGGVQPYLTASKNRLVIVKSPTVKTTAVVAESAKAVTPATATKTTASIDTVQKVKDEIDESNLILVVNFTEKKYEVADAKQEEVIKKVGLFLQRNPDALVAVSGYADKSSGSKDANNELSKKRAVNVANILANKYSISLDRIQVKWFGGAKQAYTKPSMNRLVLIETFK